jgi:hypothetical protein
MIHWLNTRQAGNQIKVSRKILKMQYEVEYMKPIGKYHETDPWHFTASRLSCLYFHCPEYCLLFFTEAENGPNHFLTVNRASSHTFLAYQASRKHC